MEQSSDKRQLEVEEKQVASLTKSMSSKLSDDPNEEEKHMNDRNDAALAPDASSLIHQLGRDLSIYCLLRLSRSDYGLISALNRNFRSLVRSGELYQLRRKMGIVEHWIYFSCDIPEWEAIDPNRGRVMRLPRMICQQCFTLANKESLAVGTELLVFGREIMALVVYKYSLLTNSWSIGREMNTPRCLFGSASLDGIAILAGGCDDSGKILPAAELYNSDTGTWETLPDLNKPRKKCSGVFMDGKFYVIGGVRRENPRRQQLSCGEEFDLKTRKWRVIPNMFPARNSRDGTDAPPLIAVVKNELYVADHAKREVKRYVKDSNSWVTIGRLPPQANSMNGWGLAFRGCGDRLIVIGGYQRYGAMVEVSSWVPGEGEPQWNLIARTHSGNFVYNCTVMGC